MRLNRCSSIVARSCLGLLTATISVWAPSPVWAQDPVLSTVFPADALGGMFVCPAVPVPAQGSINTITVKDDAGVPMAGVEVEILIGNPLCPGAVLSALTNAAGVATIVTAGGGCVSGVDGACEVWADPPGGLPPVLLRSWTDVKGPDWDGGGSDLSVGLPDVIAFTREFLGVDPSGCHDYNNDGNCNLPDLVLFAYPFFDSAHCP